MNLQIGPYRAWGGRSQRAPSPSRLRLAGGAVVRFPAIMGVLNVTPDSFSDGGRYLDPDRAVAHAIEMAESGASIIDIGGESSRPQGAREVSAQEELNRILPVLRKLAGRISVPISIDTRKSAVARAALDEGAAIINDISALESDPAMAPLAAGSRCAVVLMHMRGSVADHSHHARYRDVVAEVKSYLAARARHAIGQGIARSRIIVDPGLGFAKTARHNLAILAALPSVCSLGYPVLIGASRKTFVRKIAGSEAIDAGSAAVDAIAVMAGASIVRVHDPASALAAIRIASAIAKPVRRNGTRR